MDTNFGDKRQSGFPIKPGISAGFARLLLIALIPAIFLWLINLPPAPAAAQSAGEYFQIDYSSASLSQSEVNGDVVFYATISGKITCVKDLPMSVSEAIITSRVVAENAVKGTVTLNPGYTLAINPFPSKTGEFAEIKQTVQLQFPARAASGDYNVVAVLSEAKVKAALFWVPVTEFLPQSQFIGSVKYVSPGISQAPSPAPVVPPPTPLTPAPVLLPSPASAQTPSLPPASAALPSPQKTGFAWWMWLVVAIALATTIVNIYFIMRYRNARQAGK